MFGGPFFPQYGKAISVTTGASSASVSIPAGVNQSVRIQNTSATNGCFVRIGNSQNGTVTITASSTSPNADCYIGPNSYMTLSKALNDDTVAYIQAAGTATLWIMTGEGGLL
jgi:hypothetical protein